MPEIFSEGGVQWTHSVSFEDDYVNEWMAPFLGLSLQYELIFDEIGVFFSWAEDPRVLTAEGYEAEPAPVQSGVGPVTDLGWRGVGGFCPSPERRTFQDPTVSMCCPAVEPDVARLQEQDVMSLPSLPSSVVALGLLGSRPPPRLHCLHLRKHALPLQVTFEALSSVRHCNQLKRTFALSTEALSGLCPSSQRVRSVGDTLQCMSPTKGQSASRPPTPQEVHEWCCKGGSLSSLGTIHQSAADSIQCFKVGSLSSLGTSLPDSLRCPLDMPSAVEDDNLRELMVTQVKVLPSHLDIPEVRCQPLATFRWHQGFRATGADSAGSQYNRYAVFSTVAHVQVRPLPGTGSLDEVIFDLIAEYPGLRSIRLLQPRLSGFPAAQFVVALRTDPLDARLAPVDFRPLQGRVCTVDFRSNEGHRHACDQCIAQCPKDRLPRGHFSLRLPDGQTMHRAESLDFLTAGPEIEEDDEFAAIVTTCTVTQQAGRQTEGHQRHTSLCGARQRLGVPRERLHSKVTPSHLPILAPPGSSAARPPQMPLRPTEIAFMRAARATVFPPDLDGSALYFPLERIILELRPQIDPQGRGRYTVFEPGARPRVRSCGADWVLGDFAADAAGSALFPVRAIQFLTRPLHGFPIPQLVLSPTTAPALHYAVVFDLRHQGTDVITACIPPVLQLDALEPFVAAGAPIPAMLRFRQGTPQALLDSAGRRHAAITPPLAKYEWVVPQFGPQDPDLPVTAETEGSEADRLRDPSWTSRQSDTSQVQELRREAVLPGDPPPTAHTRRMANPTARPTCECLPEELFAVEQSVVETLQFPIIQLTGRNGAPCFPFTVLGWHQEPKRLTAGMSWSLQQLAVVAQASAWDDTVRAVHVIQSSLPGLAAPQLVLTPANVTAPWRVMPVDLRPLGGGIFPTPVEPEMHVQDIFESILPFTTTDVAVQLRLQGGSAPFLQDQFGAVLTSLPADLGHLDWLVVRARGAAFLGPYGCSTTSTTTLMRLREDERLSFTLVHGPKVLRTSPVLAMGSRPEQSLALLVGTYARQTRLPDMGTIHLLQAFPLREEGTFVVPFVLARGLEDTIAVVLDTTLNGRGMYSVEAPVGTWAEQLLTQAQREQELTFLCNGLPLHAVRRPLEMGDYLQLVHINTLGQPSVTPATYLMHCLQSLRLWSLPVALPPLTHVRGPLNTQLAERNNRAFMRFFQTLASRRLDIFGRFESGCNSLWVLSARHPPFQFAFASPYRPTLEEAQSVLRASGIFTAQDRVTEAERAISISGTAFVRFRDDDPFVTVLMPAPLQPEFFQAAAISVSAPPPLRLLPRSQYTTAFAPFPFAQGVAYSLLVPTASAADKAARTRPRPASLSGSLSLLQTQVRRSKTSIATPFGRRTLPPAPAVTLAPQSADDGSSKCPDKVKVELCKHLPAQDQAAEDLVASQGRRASLQFGVTVDMFDFVFGSFGLGVFDLDLHHLAAVPQCSSDFIRHLPRVNRAFPIDALQLYVDGSYFPDSGQGASAGWAIIALGLQEGQWCWVGICAACAPIQGSSSTLGTGVRSCFEVELAAICHAMTTAVALPIPVLIGYDSTSAGDLAQGFATADSQTALTDATVSLAHLLDALGRRPRFLHIHSHKQHPLNELADQAAKEAARRRIASAISPSLDEAARDGVLSRLWLAIGASPSIPALSCGGALVDTVTPSEGPSLAQVLGDPPSPGEASLHFKMCTYNCLSLASQAQKESLSRQFLQLQLSIIGLQETRCNCDPRQHLQDFHVLGSDAHQGQLGCQIWFSKRVPIGKLRGEPLFWDPAGFSVVLRKPRILLVFAKIGCFRIAVMTAHSPTSKAPVAERRMWWADLHQAFSMIPCNCVPIVLIDANARLACPVGSPSDNACELAHSDCVDSEGNELVTWVGPGGQRACIDYALFPETLREGIRSLGPLAEFEGLLDHDHRPVVVELCMRRRVSQTAAGPRLDYQHLRTPLGRQELQRMLCSLPAIPWETGVDEHLAVLNAHISKGLAHICPKLVQGARRPITTTRTWLAIQHRRELRRDCHKHRLLAQLAVLRDCFCSWRAGRREVSEDAHLQGLHLGLIGLQIGAANRLVTRLAKEDAAEASRHIFSEARNQGPDCLFRLFRGVMKAGRGYKRPNLMPALLQADGTAASDSQSVLGQHFAAAERAIPERAAAICTRPARTEDVVLEAVDAICLPQLAHAFGSMATRKASGLSGIPAEVFRFAPGPSAAAHAPLVYKMLLRCQYPLLWRGGRAAPIEKPGKSLTTPGGWRSIMLMEAGAKGLGGALRQELLKGFEAIRVEGQGGSRPKAPMQTAMSQVRGFLTELHARQRSGGVIFVDGQTAFYATIRQGLLGQDAHSTLSYLNHLATVLFDDEPSRDRFIATATAPGLLARCDVQPEVRRLIAASLDTTWFSMGYHGEDAFLTRTGTTPGAPLADLTFQYVFSTVLDRLKARLAEVGCVATVGKQQDIHVPSPTWMDDLAIPFTTESAAEVIPTAALALGEVALALRDAGISINWGRGKSELLPIFYGPGAKAVRTKWCTTEGATFTVKLPDGSATSAHITPAYIHLGSLADMKGGDIEDIRRRRILARELLGPLMKLLCNPFLEAPEKIELLIAMPVARFKHGAGLWRLSKKSEREAFHAGYMELVRRAFRPIVGCSSRGLTDEDVCDGLGVLSPSELRTAEICRHAAWLWADESASIRALWFSEGGWLEEAKEAVRLCAPTSPSCTDPWDLLLAQPTLAKGWIRGYIKHRRALRRTRGAAKIPLWQALAAARQNGWIFCKIAPPVRHTAAHRCDFCSQTFRTAAALASHSSKTHGVLDASDVVIPDEVVQRYHFAWPPAAPAQGPKPFWATLRPPCGDKPSCRPSASISWPVLPSTAKGVVSKDLPEFVRRLVEIGIAHNPDDEDLPLHLLSDFPSAKRGMDSLWRLEAIHLSGHSALSLVFAIRRACNKHDGPYEKQIANANTVLKILAEFQVSATDVSVPEATADMWETVLRDKEAADVKISVVEKQLPEDEVFVSTAGTVYAHSLVLKAVSPVLKALLSSPMLEGATGTIQVEGVGMASVHLLLQLLYTGTTPDADHDPNVLLGTLDLAHRWQAAHVVDIVEGALVKKIKLENLGAFCETALLKGLPTLRNACKRFAQSSTEAANLSRILQSKDFPQCARDELSAPKPPQKRRRRHP
ncbi:unnamed protein product [Symbiodinium sp. CCMP2592]|nr:unnamed protein product [Symbiodinium sp. CCMP2592]